MCLQNLYTVKDAHGEKDRVVVTVSSSVLVLAGIDLIFFPVAAGLWI